MKFNLIRIHIYVFVALCVELTLHDSDAHYPSMYDRNFDFVPFVLNYIKKNSILSFMMWNCVGIWIGVGWNSRLISYVSFYFSSESNFTRLLLISWCLTLFWYSLGRSGEFSSQTQRSVRFHLSPYLVFAFLFIAKAPSSRRCDYTLHSNWLI